MHNPYAPPPDIEKEPRLMPPSRGWWILIGATLLAAGLALRAGAWDTVRILIAILALVSIAPWHTRIEAAGSHNETSPELPPSNSEADAAP